jgi:hypothetical protein
VLREKKVRSVYWIIQMKTHKAAEGTVRAKEAVEEIIIERNAFRETYKCA